MPKPEVPGVSALAHMYGVQTAFYDVDGRRQRASTEALLSVLRALGAPVESFADVPAALRQRRQQSWAYGVEPVAVAWEGHTADVALRLPAQRANGTIRCHLSFENGDGRDWTCALEDMDVSGAAVVNGVRYQSSKLPLPPGLPCGYHHLTLEWGSKQFETLVISAPLKAYRRYEGGRVWGVFLPTYALRSERNWGAGDLTDLESLLHWVRELGGNVVATLPLLAAFLDEPFEPSPYAPASRLFWNEFYVDVTRVPELDRCPAARAIVGSPEFQLGVQEQRTQPQVDFRGLMSLKRTILKELARCFFAAPSERFAEYVRFLEAHPAVEDYARFRAAGERQRTPWPQWPRSLRDGVVQPADYEEETERYHLYVQWLAHEQMGALSSSARSKDVRLYLDLPLGVHPGGYDIWRERSLFAQSVSAGAPPDTFFAGGQNWGFHPPNPEKQRKQSYHHLIACLRHHLQHAGTLRIDHVMGLHRLYWIPDGSDARHGAYVRYPAEELYAILSLESHRNEAEIVGEDLGTVPHYVRQAMARHGLQRSYVMQIEPTATSGRPFGSVPAASVASLNTHDTPPFAAYWGGVDTEERQKLGALDETAALSERRSREKLKQALLKFLKHRGLLEGAETRSILRACLAYLSATSAQTVLVNLEDIWLETQPQNVPGTFDEHPNWRRKARHTLEEFRRMPEVIETLQQMDHLRKAKARRAAAK